MPAPPKIVYLLCGLAWLGLALVVVVRLVAADVEITPRTMTTDVVVVGLTVYFSYFAVRRIKYDSPILSQALELRDDVELSEGATVQLCRIGGEHALKVNLLLRCEQYESDDSFSLQFLDGKGQVVHEDSFVPVLGSFRLENEFPRESLPLTVLLKNSSRLSRTIHSRINYAEV